MKKNKKTKSKKNNKNYQVITLTIINVLLLMIISFILIVKNTCKLDEQSIIIKEPEKDLNYENIVFLGDSITDWYPFEEMFASDIPIVNSGIAGYETTDIIERLNEMVYQYNPTKVFILIGTNDLKYEDDSEEEVIANTKKIITEIKKNRPNTEIYLQSIFPVNRESKYHLAEERYNDEILEVNAAMKKYCEENDVTYINMYDELTDDKGNFNKNYTNDGLHPTDKGYIKITSVLLRYIY